MLAVLSSQKYAARPDTHTSRRSIQDREDTELSSKVEAFRCLHSTSRQVHSIYEVCDLYVYEYDILRMIARIRVCLRVCVYLCV